MAHFAEIDENNIVTRVCVFDDNATSESIKSMFGGNWIQTSYNMYAGQHRNGGTPLRKNYAGTGYSYNTQRDAFIPPKPFTSWTLNESTCCWEPPTPMPTDGIIYVWDESLVNWKAAA